MSTYFIQQNPEKQAKGKYSKIRIKRLGVKFANFQVLRETIEFMPSMLSELGFLSNRDEVSYYNTKKIEAIALLFLRESLKP